MSAANAVTTLATELEQAAGTPVELERPAAASHGDYATNVALRMAPQRGRAPRELAEEIAQAVGSSPSVERAEVAGAGFVNVWVAPAWYHDALAELLEQGQDYGSGWAAPRERFQVEMVSANPTGPITVASGRNAAYGDSVARLVAFAGHDVEREYYYNDSGAQMDRFRASVDAVRRGEQPPEDGYHGEYIAELAAIEGDPVPPMRDRIEVSSDTAESDLVKLAKASDNVQRQLDGKAIVKEIVVPGRLVNLVVR